MGRRRLIVSLLELVLVDLEFVGGFFLLLDLDFLFEGVLQVRGGLLELVEAAAEGLAQFRQFPGPENDQRDHHDDDELRHADGTKHRSSLLPPQDAKSASWGPREYGWDGRFQAENVQYREYSPILLCPASGGAGYNYLCAAGPQLSPSPPSSCLP